MRAWILTASLTAPLLLLSSSIAKPARAAQTPPCGGCINHQWTEVYVDPCNQGPTPCDGTQTWRCIVTGCC
jgi:hypothetical protein